MYLILLPGPMHRQEKPRRILAFSGRTQKFEYQVNSYYLKRYFTALKLQKAMAPHSSALAWQIPWTEEPGGLQPMGSLGVGHDERLHFDFSLSCIGEGNGNLLQCSCLENPRDGGAWWAAVHGVAQSWTRLK